MNRGLARLNGLSTDQAVLELMRCCGSSRWAAAMAARCPFKSAAQLHAAAEEIWRGLRREDWLEAFAHHPRIGGAVTDPKLAAARQWSQSEQSGMAGAPEELRQRLAQANDAYLNKFGYTFLICATGRSAGEMLDQLLERLENDAETELAVAVEEQRLITRLRLEKMLAAMSER
jgi:2-oxo-4-hydroxy-4-carboxy-5-ureidoimidazoline decarboxylase